MEKKRQFYFFMTMEDEKLFCKEIRDNNPNIYFLDTRPSYESDIDKRLFKSIVDSSSPFFSIVNFDLLNKIELSKRYKKYGEYVHYSQIAKEQMQFLRSVPDSNNILNLREGRIADSYDSEDNEEKIWKKMIYDILKKMGKKVYWYYHTSEGIPEIKEKAENRIVALPNALLNYNGKDGFMTHGSAKFVGKGITIEELK